MKIRCLLITGLAAMCGAVWAQKEEAHQPTLFDSLCGGKEIVLTPEDFGGSRSATASAFAENTPAGADKKESSHTTLTSGFQVQFFASTQEDLTKKEKARIEESLQLPVQIVHQPPYFKLRSKTFSTRKEAENFKTRMRELGHSSVWIVKTWTEKRQ